jgi:hypothetical protein
MPVALASELWGELKRYISTVDREEAAETVVNILIDNDIDADEIKANFKGDSDIKRALAQYSKDTEEVEEDDDESYEDDDY